MVNNSSYVEKKCSTSIFKPFSFTSNRKCLARKSSTKDIEIWNFIQFDIVYIGIEKFVIAFFVFCEKRWFDGLVVFFISYASVLVPFTRKNAFATNGMHCRVESTDTSKQINKSKYRLAIVLDNFFTRHFSLHFESERVHSRGSGSGRFAWPRCGQKETAGSRLTPRLKVRHFQRIQ